MQKIILTGPESSGKTTLAQQLATHFQVEWLPEYAREYLQKINRNYEEADLLKIAKGQFLQEENALQNAALKNEKFLIVDTSFLVLKIWSIVKYRKCDSFILNQLNEQKQALFILCGSEIDWEFDPLRENPKDRNKLYLMYKKELEEMNAHFIEVKGSPEERLEICLKKISEI